MSDIISLHALNDTAKALLDAEGLLTAAHRDVDGLRRDLDKLAIEIEAVLRERERITATLTAFYKSNITMSSLQPVLDLCVELNPTLKAWGRL